jgi:hypothetical protein
MATSSGRPCDLMAIGEYRDPTGAFFPPVFYRFSAARSRRPAPILREWLAALPASRLLYAQVSLRTSD